MTGAIELMTDSEDLSPTSFSSIPNDLIEEVRAMADSRGFTLLRFAYEEAITRFCDDLDAGLKIETWPSSRPGLAKAKHTVRMSNDITERMREMVRKYNTRKGVFFRVALIRWLSQHGVEVEL
jgi:hypothetical protein